MAVMGKASSRMKGNINPNAHMAFERRTQARIHEINTCNPESDRKIPKKRDQNNGTLRTLVMSRLLSNFDDVLSRVRSHHPTTDIKTTTKHQP